MPATDLYPTTAFYFKVVFVGSPGADQSFQEVSGIGAELDTEEVPEGGENRFIHRLPKATKHPLLELKRAIAPLSSQLVVWCQSVLESDFDTRIAPKQLSVYLLDQDGKPLRGWSFANTFPVKWEIGAFNSTKNEVAIETISLSYTISKRLV
jgi:phage tail-like protein